MNYQSSCKQHVNFNSIAEGGSNTFKFVLQLTSGSVNSYDKSIWELTHLSLNFGKCFAKRSVFGSNWMSSVFFRRDSCRMLLSLFFRMENHQFTPPTLSWTEGRVIFYLTETHPCSSFCPLCTIGALISFRSCMKCNYISIETLKYHRLTKRTFYT